MTAAPRSLDRARLKVFGGALLAIIALVLSVLTGTPAASAADLTKFQPGNIIGDAVFFNKDAMPEAQIQSFLQAKVPTCKSGYTCLKDWYDTSRTTTADAMCGAYSGGVRERASRIIFKVAQACGINPQVFLVMLQKEKGLVLSTAPTESQFKIAMGQGCPDTAACDTRYFGFFNQVYGAAWQLKRYANPPGTSRYFTWYEPGKTWNILYNFDKTCGSSPVFIQNQATANLYYYTPYQPNSAALRAGYGEGDACSAYGNRNFYSFFTDWFGSTQYLQFAAAPAPSVSGAAVPGQILTAGVGTWAPAPSTLTLQWLRNGKAIPGATTARYGVTTDDGGATLSVRVTATRTGYATQIKNSASIAARAFTVTRLAGDTRYETAIAVSKQAYPTGAKTVYIGTGMGFADALAASALAARQGAALLLAPANAMPGAVAAELKRLAPTSVVLIGGAGVLDSGTEARVKSVLGAAVSVSRLAGVDRYDTARLIAAAGGASPTAYVVTGRDFPDALGAAAVAGAKDAPVLLVDGMSSALDARTVALLRTLGSTSVVIVGGAGVVSNGIAAHLANLGIGVTRYAGANRYETNAALIAGSFGASLPQAVAVTAWDFPDALTGSVLAARRGAPLFVTDRTCASPSMADLLRDRAGAAVTIVGGVGVVSQEAARFVRC